MKKGIILNLKRFKLLDYVTYNKIIIFIFAFFVFGILIGSLVLIKNVSFYNNVKIIFEKILQKHLSDALLNKIIFCFLNYFIVLIVYYIFGTTMLGVALVPFTALWQGIFIGAIIAYVYSLYGLTGIAFNAIILIPPMAIFTVCCFFAAKYSINFSICIARLTLPKYSNVNLNIAFKNYCQKYIIFILIAILCAFVEVFVNLFFLKFFNF